MKIGILSDTHDNLPMVKKTIELFQKEKVEMIIHCGDWVSPFVAQYVSSLEPKLSITIKSVFGNNEGDHFDFIERSRERGWNIEFYKDILELEIDGKKIVVYHGSNDSITHSLIYSKKYDIVLTGHTHIYLIENVDGVLHINPGTTSGYKMGKITDDMTVAFYDTESNIAKIINLNTI